MTSASSLVAGYRSLFVSTRSTVRSRVPKAPTKTWRVTSALPTQCATPSIASSSSFITVDMTAADREDTRRLWARWMFKSPSIATPRATSSQSLSYPKTAKSDCNLCRVLSNGKLALTKMATRSSHASLRRLKARVGLARAALRRSPRKQPCERSAKPSRRSERARKCRTPFPLRRASSPSIRGGTTASSPEFPTVTNRRHERRLSVGRTSFLSMETTSKLTTNIDGFPSEDLERGTRRDKQDTP